MATTGIQPRRPYRFEARQASMAAGRERIIDSARALIGAYGLERASIDTIARRAGVSRATVYNRFGSKSGLVDALIADSMTRSGIDQVVRAREAADAFDAVRRYIPEVCRFWESDFAVWRNLMYFSGLDSDAGQVGEKYDVMRREGVAFLVARLRDAGYLRRGISATHAEHALWTLTDFHIYDHLRHQCGMPVGEVAGALWSMASYLFVER